LIGPAWAENEALLRGLPGNGFDAQQEPRERVGGHQSGGELEEVVLAVAVGVDQRAGVRVVEAEVSVLLRVVQTVARVAAKVVGQVCYFAPLA
jgi:hypothetical protein